MVYLLALNSDSSSVLEIIPSSCFLQKNYPTDGLRIIGICGNRREAKEMCRSLIEEVWREQGDFDLASYWERRQKKEQQT